MNLNHLFCSYFSVETNVINPFTTLSPPNHHGIKISILVDLHRVFGLPFPPWVVLLTMLLVALDGFAIGGVHDTLGCN